MSYRRAIVFGLLVLIALHKTRPAEAGEAGMAEPANPQSPRILQCTESAGHVLLQWQKDSQIVSWEIYRAENGDLPVIQTKLSAPEYNLWNDSHVSNGSSYVYYIKAVDENHRISWSAPAKIALEQSHTQLWMQFEDIKHDTENKKVYFRWTAPQGHILSYRILATQAGSTVTLCRVDGLATEFVYHYDVPLKNVVFSIVAMDAQGRLSAQ